MSRMNASMSRMSASRYVCMSHVTCECVRDSANAVFACVCMCEREREIQRDRERDREPSLGGTYQ